MPVLKVDDLKTHFFTEEGVVKAVDGVSFTLGRGEVLGVVGESGSGKSVMSLSLLRLVADPPGRIVSGKIVLDTEAGRVDITQASEAKMQKIRGDRVAMIFQDPMTSLNPYLTVGRQLLEVLEIHRKTKAKEAKRKVVEMLEAVGIPDPERRFDDHPHELSGGMRQRVMIAMALLCDPEVLVADEPTTALDVTIQAQILELIRERKESTGAAVILITHDLGVVARLADRVAVMYAGRIVEEGPVARIFEAPHHPYTVGLARSIPRLDDPSDPKADIERRLLPIAGMPPSLAKLPKGCAFAPRCPAVRAECADVYPSFRDLGKGHRVACHEKDIEKVRRAPEEAS